MKLRLLLTEKCNRNCTGCCNKDWDLENLPVCHDFEKYEMIMLTGGEPFLYPYLIREVVRKIRYTSKAKIIVYTAMSYNLDRFYQVLKIVDGITLTLHEQRDVKDFDRLNTDELIMKTMIDKSMRLNVFKDIELNIIPSYWKVKDNIEWIENCPLPKDEDFMKIGDDQ